MRDSISLRGEATNERGNERYHSMRVVHATRPNEQLIYVDVMSGHRGAQHEMTFEEATPYPDG